MCAAPTDLSLLQVHHESHYCLDWTADSDRKGRHGGSAEPQSLTTSEASARRIGYADVAFTTKQYVQTDLEAGRQVANTLAELILGGSLASSAVAYEAGGRHLAETACGQAS
jgi:hypothetical protein